jgi:chaperonin GroEL (HSP60 family)
MMLINKHKFNGTENTDFKKYKSIMTQILCTILVKIQFHFSVEYIYSYYENNRLF